LNDKQKMPANGGGEYWQALIVSTNWTGVVAYKELNPKSLGGCRILTLGIPVKGFTQSDIKLPFSAYRLKLANHNTSTISYCYKTISMYHASI
jgi:hypothetical protein